MNIQHHIFISYSRRDSDMMIKLRQIFTDEGFQVWTDEKLTAGTRSWKSAIEKAIQGTGCMVVLMSPDAKLSEWVERELDYAYIFNRQIFPVLIRGNQRESIPFEIINAQYVDLRSDFEDGKNQLINALKKYFENISTPENVAGLIEKELEKNDKDLSTETIVESVDKRPGKSPLEAGENDEIILSPTSSSKISGKSINQFQRMLFWYLIEPRKFRRLISRFPGSTPENIHGVLISFTSLMFMYAMIYFDFFAVAIQNSLIFLEYIITFALNLILLYGFLSIISLSTTHQNFKQIGISLLRSLLIILIIIMALIPIWLLAELLIGRY